MRASFTDHDVTIYQAFTPQIADAAVAARTFVTPFKRDRMTWIKPSFLWMMHRSGWATKPGQERILAIQTTRDGFEWALQHAALSHYEHGTYDSQQQWAECLRASPVRVQWDPDRSLTLVPLTRRALQVGLSGEAVSRYLDHWITGITDITPLAERIHRHVTSGDPDTARAELPAEHVYPLPAPIRSVIGAGRPSGWRTLLVNHLARTRSAQQPVQRAEGGRPARDLDRPAQFAVPASFGIPPEPLPFRGFQPIQPVRQGPALLTFRPGLVSRS